MKKTLLILTVSTLALVSVLIVAGANWQNVKRIKFAKDRKSATILSAITKENSSVTYLLDAKAGQKLKIDFEPDSGSALPVVMIYPPGKSAEKDKILDEGGGGEYEVELTATGDYSIAVACVRRCRYSLTVTIE